ncbi:hypothetical protein E8E14_007863 [Neopestalotiopsis sp. 37M]|nr:hypothetical protein E8E14_007863 [Neopestalotiopsis sp. 37M]
MTSTYVPDDAPVIETEVLIVGSGPVGATYARKLVDAGIEVLMVEIGAQETPIPGDHKKNNYVVQKDINSFINVVQGELNLLSVPTDPRAAPSLNLDPSAWSIDASTATIHNGQNPCQDSYYNLPAAAATRIVGGMGSHWTNCTPRQHPKLERSDLFNDSEWDALYGEAEERIKTNSTLYSDSIRQQLVLDTLRKGHYHHGDREFKPMPLAAQKLPDQTYFEWSCSATLFGDITKTVDRPGAKNFTLKSQVQCIRLITSQDTSPDGVVLGALCKDLKTDRQFLVRARKYVLCAGAVLTPGIMFKSGWNSSPGQLPALGKYLTEQTMAFCQIVLSRSLVDEVEHSTRPDWAKKVKEHHQEHPQDPLPFPFTDLDPQVYTPVSENYPWHTQIHRDAFSYGQVPSTIDQRLIVDLRWFGWIAPVESNSVTFSKDITDQFGMPQPTFHYEVPKEDAERTHRMMEDMCLVASKLGGFLPGAEPKFLVPGSALHISGTTRAGTSKKDSVCDRYGRVWDTKNLVVGGCNVIPTGAACNPTLTAVCFAIAGADKMIEEFRSKADINRA